MTLHTYITMKLVNTPTETTLMHSIVNGFYKITSESINLVLDVDQFGQVVI